MPLTRSGKNLMIKIMMECLKALNLAKHSKFDKKLVNAYRD
jgi:hypothetical protein